MPCYYTGSREGDMQMRAEESAAALTKVTALLCSLCEACELRSMNLPPAVDEWWEEHRKVDAERRRLESHRRITEQASKEADEFRRNRLKELGGNPDSSS